MLGPEALSERELAALVDCSRLEFPGMAEIVMSLLPLCRCRPEPSTRRAPRPMWYFQAPRTGSSAEKRPEIRRSIQRITG